VGDGREDALKPTFGQRLGLKDVEIAPLTEEATFQGLLLGGFLLVYRRWTAILLAAALVAAIHRAPVQAVTALGSGRLLSWVMAESRRLALPLLRHPVTFGILGVFALAPGTGLLRRTLRPPPRPPARPSLTMEAP
jgi:hypothetical protein